MQINKSYQKMYCIIFIKKLHAGFYCNLDRYKQNVGDLINIIDKKLLLKKKTQSHGPFLAAIQSTVRHCASHIIYELQLIWSIMTGESQSF